MTDKTLGSADGLASAASTVHAGGRPPARATVDLDAIRRNVEVLARPAGSAARVPGIHMGGQQ